MSDAAPALSAPALAEAPKVAVGATSPAAAAPQPASSGLLLKYLLSLVGLVGLVLVLNSGLNAWLSYNQARDAQARLQDEKADAAAQRIGEFIAEIERQIGWTTHVQWDLGSIDQRRVDYIRLLRQAPAISELIQLDREGKEQLKVSRLSVDVVNSGQDYATDPRFTEALAQRLRFGSVYFRKESEPFLTMSVARGGRTPGVTIAEVNLKLIWDVITTIRIGQRGYAYVVDGDGRLIAHPDISQVLRNSDFTSLPQVTGALARLRAAGPAPDQPTVDGRDPFGRPVIAASAAIPRLKWLVFVELPASEALAPLYAALVQNLALLLGGLVLAALSALALARRMTAPILDLSAGAARLGSGDLSHRIAPRSGSGREIETLARNFNLMGAQLQESYAGLERKVEERTRALAEALEFQTATGEVLGVISRSPTNLQPVLDTIVVTAARLCDAEYAFIARAIEGKGYLAAANRMEAEHIQYLSRNPVNFDESSVTGRVALTQSTVHVPDVLADPHFKHLEWQRVGKQRTVLGVPLLREGRLIGVTILARTDVRPFTVKQIELVETFADQAVIAIENARLFEEVQAKTRDLQESLEYQTATSDILRAISGSLLDIAPVFDAILENAIRLCGGDTAVLWQFDGQALQLAASRNMIEEAVEHLRRHPLAPGAYNPTAQAALERRVVHVLDVFAEPGYRPLVPPGTSSGRRPNAPTVLAVPLLREGVLLGVITIWRYAKRLFTDKQVELVATFADQAVIAIENARLFEEVQARTRELTEALEYQTATSDVLGVISRSPSQVQPVLDTIVETALRLCDARYGLVTRLGEDGLYHFAASARADAGFLEWMRAHPMAKGDGTATGIAAMEKRTAHLPDALADSRFTDFERQKRSKARTQLAVPLMRDGEVVGVIFLARIEVRPFTDKQVDLVTTFADQAVIAIENARLFEEVQARTAELTESLEYQTATSEVLGVISRSPSEIQPVLDSIVETAARICHAWIADVILVEGEHMRVRATFGDMGRPIGEAVPLDRASVMGRSIVDRLPVQVADLLHAGDEFPRGQQFAERFGHRTILAVPLLREGRALGTILLRRATVEPFSEKQIALLKTFADQAVIAINNVGLFEEVQARTRELTESLEYQTATSDVLNVISRSPSQAQPVLETIVATGGRLCEADYAFIFMRKDDGKYHIQAVHPADTEYMQFLRDNPVSVGRGTTTGRAALEKRTIHIPDAAADPDYAWSQWIELSGARTFLGVPLIRHGEIIGVIAASRKRTAPYAPRQIELFTTFADQAVIAIENARLFEEVQARTRELTESLEHQTATSEVLGVISRSPSDVQPVLDAIVVTAARLCAAEYSFIMRQRGEEFHLVAANHVESEHVHYIREHPVSVDRGSVVGRVALERKRVHVADVLADPEFRHLEWQKVGRQRTVLGVPLLREGVLLGVLLLVRTEAKEFAEKQIELVETFADQAVIAIENARLFEEVQARNRELRMALSQQTATSDLLKVIGRSTFDLKPVFDALAESAVRLCEAERAFVFRFDGELLRAVAWHNPSPELIAFVTANPIRLGRHSVSARAGLERKTVHVHDVQADPEFSYASRDIDPIRTMLAVPMLRGDELLGVTVIYRVEMRPFTESHIALMKTFADQAVIAIENARLFEEVQARTRELTESLEYQTATSDVLGVISRSPSELQPVLDAIVVTAQRLCQAQYALFLKRERDGSYHLGASTGADPNFVAWMHSHPVTAGDGSAVGIAIRDRQTIHLPDALADPRFTDLKRQAQSKARTMLGVPLLRRGEVIGVIFLARTVVHPFTDRQISLVTTFADQAVIAINNVGLFEEVQARTRDLTQSVQELKALGETSQAVTGTLDLRTVLDTIVARALDLGEADACAIFRYRKAERIFVLWRSKGLVDSYIERLAGIDIHEAETAMGRAVREGRPVALTDLAEGPQLPLRDIGLASGYRSVLIVPLVRAGRIFGAMTLLRQRAGAFPPSTAEVLLTFANQSVLAIQNARLFREIEDKGRQLELASQHKSQFLANMSHELRTPLNAVLGYAEMLADGLYGQLPEKAAAVLDRIQKNGKHLLELINDVLDLAKIEAGQLNLAMTDYSVAAMVETVKSSTESLAGNKGLALETRVAAGLPLGRGDERRLTQVLLNLVGNALKFTDHGKVEIVAALDGERFDIAVTDTGPGIAPEDQARIFEKFQQVDDSSTRKKGGTGLGLAISRQIVAMHGGELSVTSKLGEGSTFRVSLPVRAEEDATEAAA